MSEPSQQVVIVGAGFAGLGMGIRLKQAGLEEFVILEQGERVGGTWRDNSYPGAACDIQSHLYSFSFAPNPEWSRAFAPQAEILAYLEQCVERFGLRPHLRLGEGARRADYDEASGTWRVETTKGAVLTARALVSSCGGLSQPKLPDLPGLSDFRGKAFHSARWDHGYPLAGKRVAVVGTGASAIQIVPSIAAQVERLHLYQRTPAWVIPKADRAFSAGERERFRRSPARAALERQKLFWRHELMTAAFVSGKRPAMLRLGARLARHNLERAIRDPALRAKLTPNYAMGCKRVLISNDYFPALARPNVEVVTERIERVLPRAVRTADGREREIDALILATGFYAAEPEAPFQVRGRVGRDLAEAWREGVEAYLGTTVVGFPNLFFIVGPNTGLGSSSMILMIEAQVAYILDCVRTMRARGLASVEVLPEAQARFNRSLTDRLADTVWASGCGAWYTTKSGRNTVLWPGTTLEFRFRTRRFDPGAYLCRPLATAPAGAPAPAPG